VLPVFEAAVRGEGDHGQSGRARVRAQLADEIVSGRERHRDVGHNQVGTRDLDPRGRLGD
jgi:hypothetical protein